MPDDDEATPPHGHPRHAVPGGEVGARLRDVEARLVLLDERDAEQHAAIVGRIDVLTRGVETVGIDVVARLDALTEAHRQTLALRAMGLLERCAERTLTPASAPLYAAAFLVAVVAISATRIEWGDMHVGGASNANADSDQGDMPASVGGGVSPEPEP